MNSSRSALLAAAALAALLMPDAALADDACGAGYHQTGTQEERQGDTIIVHPVCEADAAPAPKQAPAPLTCDEAKRRAAVAREVIGQQAHLSEVNQKFLAQWNKMGVDARNNMVLHSIDALTGSVAAGATEESEEFEKLTQEADALRSRMRVPYNPKYYVQKLRVQQIMREMYSVSLFGRVHQAAEAYKQGRESWDVLKASMQNAFQTGAENSARLQEILSQDAEDHEALAGDPDEARHELERFLLKQAQAGAVKMAEKFVKYGKWAGPTVRVADFVLNAVIDDYQMGLSTDRVDQANANAGQLAIAAGIAQKKYKTAVDNLRTACRAQ